MITKNAIYDTVAFFKKFLFVLYFRSIITGINYINKKNYTLINIKSSKMIPK